LVPDRRGMSGDAARLYRACLIVAVGGPPERFGFAGRSSDSERWNAPGRESRQVMRGGLEQALDRPIDYGDADGRRRQNACSSLKLVDVELRFGGTCHGLSVCVSHVCLVLNGRNSGIAGIHSIEEVIGINSLTGNFKEFSFLLNCPVAAVLPTFPVVNFVDKRLAERLSN
jgi:hypothetical protein